MNSWGVSELALIALVALLVVKPQNLPDLMFRLGRMIREIRRLWQNTRSEVLRELEFSDSNKPQEPHDQQ